MHHSQILRLGSLYTCVLHLLLLAVQHLMAVAVPLRSRRLGVLIIGHGLYVAWLCPPSAFLVTFLANYNDTFGNTFVAPNHTLYCMPKFAYSDEFRMGTMVAFGVPIAVTLGCYVVMVALSLHCPCVGLDRISRKNSFVLNTNSQRRRRQRTIWAAVIILVTFLGKSAKS